MGLLKWACGAASSVAILFVGVSVLIGAQSLNTLLNNNKELRLAVSRLSEEQQIGYAKVIVQTKDKNGQLWTKLKFVETSPHNTEEIVNEQSYVFVGNVIYFDLLIVRFPKDMIADGKERSLYLWRRVYSDKQAPEEGFIINPEGEFPARYKDLFSKLRLVDQKILWDNIWALSNDPSALSEYGIQAIYGNAVYKKVKPGLVYMFKLDASGNVYPETIPDL